MLTTSDLITTGKYMRASANDREGLDPDLMPTVPVNESWGFVCDNAGEDSADFFGVNVPETGLPEFAPHAFIVAYYSPLGTDAATLEAGINAYMKTPVPVPESEQCDADGPAGFWCSLPLGHEGNHAAHDNMPGSATEGMIVETWGCSKCGNFADGNPLCPECDFAS